MNRTIKSAPKRGNIPIEKIRRAVDAVTSKNFTVISDMNDTSCRQKIIHMLAEVMQDTLKVFDFGAAKHPDSGDTPNFLMKDGNRCSLKDRGSSVLRHAARTFEHPEALDEESNLPELLHLLSSASILYIRHKRNIIHTTDEE
jgi:hypothetical protein